MNKTVKLWENTPGTCTEEPVLDIYLPEKQELKAAVVIFPGGAYRIRAPHEGQGYAEFLNSHGVAAFVCQYRVTPDYFPLPLLDARRAVRYVRSHSGEFGIDPQKVYVMGSSAGGHLAALVSTYDAPIEFEGMDEVDQVSAKPDGQILCYPVITTHDPDDEGGYISAKNLLGSRYEELCRTVSPELIAGKDTPRAFIWHTSDDDCVNVINSLVYAKRLRQMAVPVEMHIYPHAPHGQGLAPDYPYVSDWANQMIRWLHFVDQE